MVVVDLYCESRSASNAPIVPLRRTSDLELTATCCVKLQLSLSLLSNPDLKLFCFLLLSANYSTYLLASASVAA